MNGKQKQPKRGKIGDRYREVKLNNENIEKKNKKEITKIAFLAMILLIVTVGTSYALFNVLVKSDKDTEIIAGTFKVNFEDGNEIILNNASPMSDEEGLNTTGYKFTVDNSGTIDAKYNVSLEERDSKEMTLDKKYVKYSIKENDGSWSEPQLLSNGLVLRKDKLLATSMKDTYELKLWLSENAPNETQGKRFDAKVVISAVQGNAVLEISGQPVINIANTNVTINEGDEFIEPVPTEIFDGNGSKIDNANIEKTYEYFDGVNTVAVDRIDTSKTGVYYIYYTVNANGKSGCTVVTVNVNKKDNGNPPVIQLNGDATQNIKNGDNYEELGASATDEEDENLSDDVVVIGTVNTLIDDTYIVKYIVEDKDGNIASITRTVNVYSSRDNVVIKLSDPTIKNNRNVINFSAISSSNDIVGYYYSNNDSKPNKKDFLQVDKTKNFNKEVELFKNGTYYFWIIDSKGNIYSDKKLISNLDTKGPVCTFNDVEYITTGKKVIELSCTDDTGIKEKFLQTSNFKISDSNVAKIIDVSAGEKIENGYKFYITLDTLKSGEFNIQLKGKSISDIFYNYNESVQKTIKVKTISSSDVTIENGEYNPDTGDLGKITLEIPNRAKIDIKDKIGDLKIVSENTDIVSVTEDGYLNPENVGKTTVTVTDQGSGAIILLNVTVIKNVKVTYVKYGKGVDSIATITSKNTTCKIDPDSTDRSCSVIMPSFTTTSPYEVIGWSSNPDLHNDIKKVGDSLNVTDDITLYSISAIPEKKYSVSWESNGATLVDGESQCIIEAIYNDDEVVNSCKVKKPTIIGSSNTPIVVGFNTDSNAHKALFTSEDNDGYLDVDSSNNGSKYYAITKNNEKKYTATFTHNGYAINYFESIEKQCTINASYNGAAQNSTCSIEQPTISLIDQDQYTMIGWNTDKNAHTGIGEDNKVNISYDVELYPITKSVAKNISATFEKSGVGVISIDSTMQSCTIEEIYNPTEPIPDSCSIPIPNFTIKDGYTAIGWNSNQKAHEKESNIYTDDNKLLISNNTTYYSISKKNAITLTADFDANGAKISDEHKACTLEEVYNDENQATECTIIAPTITRDNFIVDGYNLDDSSNITFNSSDSINLTSNKKDNDNFIESGKTWKAQTHKDINVDFNANGAQLSSTKQTCVIKNKNTNCSITSPTIERSGYEIVGYVDENNKDKDPTILSGSSLVWKQNTEKSFDDSQVYYAITYKVLNANFTYYASDNTANKLKANNNKVIVRKLGNTNKNKITETEQCTVYNKNNECSIDVPEKVSESVGPSEIKYAGLARNVNSIDDLITSKAISIKDSSDYYAIYQEKVHPKFYYYNGKETVYDDSITATRLAILKEKDGDYIIIQEAFDVPNIVKESNGLDNAVFYGVSNAKSSTKLADNISTANEEYYAIYKGTWKVNYEKDSSISAIGSTISSCNNYQTTDGQIYSQEGENCSINLPSITPKEGYTVSGWYDGDTKVGNPGDSYTISGNKTLTAKADINKYTVKYDCTTNGGTCSIADKSLNYGETADLTPTATKEGYDFLGWNTDSKATTALTTGPVVKSNTVLYAIYRKTTSISLDSKTAEYTGSAISANQATVADGDSSAITYKYYTDSSCNTQTTTSSGASSAGTAPIDVGTYYVKASTTATNGKTVSSSCVPHTITTKKISVAWGTNTEFSYNEKEQAPSYTVTNSISNEVINTSQTKATLAGNYTSTVSITSVTGGRGKKTNYELTNNTKTYTIKTATGYVTLGATSGTSTYGTTSKTFTVTGSHGGTLSVSDDNATATASISGNTVTISSIGSLYAGTVVKVTVKAAESTNYTAASQTYTLTIGKASATNPTLTAYNKAYDGSSHTIGVSGGSGGTIKYSTDKTNWSTEKPTYKDYTNGAKTIYVKVFGDSNHNDTDIISSTVTISKATGYVTLGATSGTSTYGTTSKTFTATGSGTLSVSDNNATATASISGNTVTISNLGSLNAGTVIKVTVKAAESTNYTSARATYTLTITKATGYVTLGETYGTSTYGTTSKTFTATGSGTLSVSDANATASISGNTVTISNLDRLNAGTLIKVTVTAAESTNYTSASATYTLMITKRDGEIVLLSDPSVTVPYGTEKYSFKAYGSGTLSVSDDNATATTSISGDTVTISSIGSLDAGTVVTVTVKVAESADFKATQKTFTLGICKAANPLKVTGVTETFPYSGSLVSVSNNKAGTTIYYSTTKALNSSNYTTGTTSINANPDVHGAGTYTIYYYQPGNNNYDAKSGSTTATIKYATLNVKFQKGTGVASLGSTSASCTTSASNPFSCSVSLPTYTLKSGYKDPYWIYTGTKISASSETSLSLSFSGSEYATLYGTDTEQPQITMTSTSGLGNCTVGSVCSGTASFKATDNTALSTSSYYGNSAEYRQANSTHSTSVSVYSERNGVIYIVMDVSFTPTTDGTIYGIIPRGKVIDDSGNKNAVYSATIGIVYPKKSTSPYY